VSAPNFLSSIESAFSGVAANMPIVQAVFRAIASGVDPQDILEGVEATMTSAARRQLAAELGADAHADKYARLRADADAAKERAKELEKILTDSETRRVNLEDAVQRADAMLAEKDRTIEALTAALNAPPVPAVSPTEPAPAEDAPPPAAEPAP